MGEQHKLFVIGDKKGNTLSRMKGAERCGWQVNWSVPFWGEVLPIWRRVPQYRLRDGPDIYRYNLALIKGAAVYKPNVVWVEDPMFLYPSTLQSIKERTAATLVCAYSDDPRDPNNKSRHFNRSINNYDIIFTTKDEMLQKYFDAGCQCPAKFWKGYDPARIYPIKLSIEEILIYKSDAAFIGHIDMVNGRSTRVVPMLALARAIPNTKIWGKSWGRVKWPNDLSRVINPYQLDGIEYTKAIGGAKLVVQIPSRLNHDTHSSRSLEIPACRTLMLAERTVDHQILFEEDKEAIFFNSVDEMVDKARFYIKEDLIRNKIAKAGYERCLRSGYSNYQRMNQMLVMIEKTRWNT